MVQWVPVQELSDVLQPTWLGRLSLATHVTAESLSLLTLHDRLQLTWLRPARVGPAPYHATTLTRTRSVLQKCVHIALLSVSLAACRLTRALLTLLYCYNRGGAARARLCPL